jgi:NAD(P)-dependent dehydrogenase (short-subunit alcohol dehydrogenase family)
MDVNESSALVVGGAGGLGAATVRRLAAAGARVVIADLAEETGTALAAELGSGVQFVKTDVLSDESLGAAISAAADMGPLRVSVDTHGGPGGGRTIDRDGSPLPLAQFAKVVEIFLQGTFNVLRLAAAQMATNEPLDTGERGVIVNTASIAGYEGTIGQVAYGAAKAGIIGMTLPAARDLSVLGIRVGTIAPGVIATPAYGRALDAVEAEWGPVVPFPKRMGHPDEYAHMAMAIIENPYFNGEVIRLDAGLRFQTKGSRS